MSPTSHQTWWTGRPEQLRDVHSRWEQLQAGRIMESVPTDLIQKSYGCDKSFIQKKKRCPSKLTNWYGCRAPLVPEIKSQEIACEQKFFQKTGQKGSKSLWASAWYLHVRERMHQLLQVIGVEAYLIMQDVIVSWPRSPLAKTTMQLDLSIHRKNMST
jgi:hypothetical protein